MPETSGTSDPVICTSNDGSSITQVELPPSAALSQTGLYTPEILNNCTPGETRSEVSILHVEDGVIVVPAQLFTHRLPSMQKSTPPIDVHDDNACAPGIAQRQPMTNKVLAPTFFINLLIQEVIKKDRQSASALRNQSCDSTTTHSNKLGRTGAWCPFFRIQFMIVRLGTFTAAMISV